MTKAHKVGGDLAIYDGREHVANIIDDDSGCKLCDAQGNVLGRFASRGEAIRAAYDLMPPARTDDGQ